MKAKTPTVSIHNVVLHISIYTYIFYTHTHIQGKEADYLRTQIARITHECRLAPHGHLQDVTDYEGWVHVCMFVYIRTCITHECRLAPHGHMQDVTDYEGWVHVCMFVYIRTCITHECRLAPHGHMQDITG
jgi:hypothetical protein